MKPRMRVYVSRPQAERFWEKVLKGGEDDCWIWTGAINHAGYGMMSAEPGNNRLAHRYSFTLNCSPIPKGISVCHRCDNPPCVNPAHLFLGTHTENMLDAIAKGRFIDPIKGVINRSKTHCLRGHAFTEENTLWTNGRKQRQCRTCNRDRARRERGGFGIRPTAQQLNRQRTHCPHGHEFTEENTYRNAKGWRSCRECHLIRMRALSGKRENQA